MLLPCLACSYVLLVGLKQYIHFPVPLLTACSMYSPSGIFLQAYSPLGNPGNPFRTSGAPNLLEDSTIRDIATKHNATVAQVQFVALSVLSVYRFCVCVHSVLIVVTISPDFQC